MKKASFRARILLLFFLVALLPTALILSLYLHGYISAMEQDVALSVLQTLKQAALNISGEARNVKRISDSLFVNEAIHTALRADPGNQGINEQILEITQIRNIMNAAKQGASVKAARLYVNDGKIYANEKITFYPMSDFEQDPLLRGASAKGEWTSPYAHSYLNDTEPAYIFSYVRLIKDLRQVGLTIGAIVIDLDASEMTKILDQMNFPRDYQVYLVNGEGSVISRPGSEAFGQFLPVRLDEAKANGESVCRIGDVFYAVKQVEESGWLLVAELPRSSMRVSYLSTRAGLTLYLILSLLSLGAMLLVSILLVNGAASRVQSLISLLQEGRSLPVPEAGRLPVKPGIYQTLDLSLEKAMLLIEALARQMEEQRKTQLKLLQAQINPHFLYNTLDTAQWLVRSGESEAAGRVISALTRYLRLILNNGHDIVTVEEELSLVDAYIEIQRQRFGDTFDYESIVEPDTLPCLLPKMTLQPVVENALLHGLRGIKGRRGRIDLDLYTEDQTLILSVTDNGIGMETGKPLPHKQDKSGFGIRNVDERIKLFSGSGDYGVFVDSELGKYTTVTLRIAKKQGKDAEVSVSM